MIAPQKPESVKAAEEKIYHKMADLITHVADVVIGSYNGKIEETDKTHGHQRAFKQQVHDVACHEINRFVFLDVEPKQMLGFTDPKTGEKGAKE